MYIAVSDATEHAIVCVRRYIGCAPTFRNAASPRGILDGISRVPDLLHL